ncbi:MAG: LPS assembly lipoprotein LptE [Gemmobacter sp.]
MRRRLLFLAPLALVACGFTPAYGPGGGAAALRGQVAVAEPADKLAYDLVARLEQRLGPPATPRWRLDHAITTDRIGVAITAENAVTRYNVTGAVDWSLVSLADGTVAERGRAESFTSYSTTGSTVATLAAETDASTRLMQILADQIATQLIAAAPDLP